MGKDFLACRYDDFSPLWHRIARVNREVQDRHLKLVRVGLHRRKRKRKASVDNDCRTQGALEKLRHSPDQDGNFNRFRLQFLPPSESKHALGQRRAPLRALYCVVQKAMNFRIIRDALANKFDAADDCHKQIIEVVCNAPGELTNGIHLLETEAVPRGLFQERSALRASQ